MRKKLGAKKHSFISVKQNTAMMWDGFIYKIKRRESDLELVASKGILAPNKSGALLQWA